MDHALSPHCSYVGALALAWSCLAPSAAAALQSNEPDSISASPVINKTATAAAVPDDHAIVVDGLVTHGEWQAATFIVDFTQREPHEGAPPSFRTEVAFQYDQDALYVGARMRSDNLDRSGSALTPRDDPGNAEYLVVTLDTFRDRRTAYAFAITAAGTRLDWFHPEDAEDVRDMTYDPVWTARTARDTLGWTAEFRIPFSQLRFAAARELAWGLNIKRFIPSLNEEVYWIPTPRDEVGWASRFGELRGASPLTSARRIELLPFLASEGTLTSSSLVDPRNPFVSSVETQVRAGLDAKIGLGSNLTLDATVNPDFGHVDFDPFVVNLGAFETVFDERRPFFTESAPLFSSPGPDAPRYFFSRRLGAPPGNAPSRAFVDTPQRTTILGALKLTGRLRSGLSIGAIAALTDREIARAIGFEREGIEQFEVVPKARWGVIRLNQEIGHAASTLGFTVTAVDRDLSLSDPATHQEPKRAIAGGADWLLRFDGGSYEVAGHVGISDVRGDSTSMLALQRSSGHYFQRPDQDHVTLDSSRMSMSGMSASVNVSKRGGSNWLWDIGLDVASPGWEINDVGQRTRSDEVDAGWNLTYRDTDPGVFHRWSVALDGGWSGNFGGVRRDTWMTLEGTFTFRNFMQSAVRIGYIAAGLNDNVTRGGPLMTEPRDWIASIRFSSNPTAPVRWSGRVFRGNFNLGPDWFLNTSLEFEPGGRWRISTSPRYNRRTDRRHYIATLPGGPAPTFGNRYVFGTASQSEVALPISINYSFTPDLNLSFSAEPFAASARFTAFGELIRPRSADLMFYGTSGTTIAHVESGLDEARYVVRDDQTTFEIPDGDFNVRSWRSNLVVRWDWSPGSTLLLAWRQERSARQPHGAFVSPGSLFGSLSAPGTNTLIVKATQWISFN